jgi:hypothetical protein
LKLVVHSTVESSIALHPLGVRPRIADSGKGRG